MVLGAKLKELRIRSGQSLQRVADSVGASKAHIWELETGRSRNPSIDLLSKLASHFNVSVASLVGEDPTAAGEDPEVIAMYRELKTLGPGDRETIRVLMHRLRAAQQGGSGSDGA